MFQKLMDTPTESSDRLLCVKPRDGTWQPESSLGLNLVFGLIWANFSEDDSVFFLIIILSQLTCDQAWWLLSVFLTLWRGRQEDQASLGCVARPCYSQTGRQTQMVLFLLR